MRGRRRGRGGRGEERERLRAAGVIPVLGRVRMLAKLKVGALKRTCARDSVDALRSKHAEIFAAVRNPRPTETPKTNPKTW